RMLGRLVRETADSVSFVSNGVSFTVPRSQVTAVRSIDATRKGQYLFPDPNRTRLFFAPTARLLAKGEGYFSDSRLLFVNLLGGAKRVSDRVSLVTENYAVPSVSDDIGLMYGMRFMGEKLSVDLAFMNAVGPSVTPLFPGIPYLAFAVKF